MIYSNNECIKIVDNHYCQQLKKKEIKLSSEKNNYIHICQTNCLLFAPLEM